MLLLARVIVLAFLFSVTISADMRSWADDNAADTAETREDTEATPEAPATDSDPEVETESAAETEETAETEENPPPEISYDLQALPFPTRRMHELILEATRAGDIEKLRAYIGTGDHMTLLSLGGVEGDPIEFLKQQSGDASGHELLAILEEILEAGYVRLDPGTDRELFVWPYFFAMPLDKLNDRQMVELFRIVTYGDFQDMEDFGGYIFYRVGITPTGRWQFFVAGD